ncbi:MAG: shikimate kinase [Elusimicrobia bacterium]|nr:shikimate kinase [Elusimicrobiota bacterium]
MNIVLTGMMGAGKSEVARLLSSKLKMNFIDMDSHIERTTKRSINEIFEKLGEAEFRRIERNLVKCLAVTDNFVISTGGGVVLNKKNIEDFRKNGRIVYLKAAPEVLYERVRNDSNRPLLKVDDPLFEMKRIYKNRKKFYEDCDVIVDTAGKSPEAVCDEIISKIESFVATSAQEAKKLRGNERLKR